MNFAFNFLFRIAHNSTAKPDILSSLMTTNLSNINQTNNITKPVNNLHNPYNSTVNDNGGVNNWQQTTTPSTTNNSWHSANPLVMNHQLPPPTTATTNNTSALTSPNNNFSSLDDLDPFGNAKQKQQNNSHAIQANTYTLQKPTVDYIYPVGYQQIKTNANTLMGTNNTMNLNSLMKSNSSMTPLMPQTTSTNAQQSHDGNNLNTLSQQDILSFLN